MKAGPEDIEDTFLAMVDALGELLGVGVYDLSDSIFLHRNESQTRWFVMVNTFDYVCLFFGED